MKYLILDVETTTKNNGSAFTPENKLCLISWATETESGYEKVDYDDEPYAAGLARIQQLVDAADILVGFNFKFDLHWLRRYGIKFDSKRVWDCQLVAFLLSRQTTIFPSLDEELARYNLGAKLGTVKSEFWDLGIDTDQVPFAKLAEYGEDDARLTRSLFQTQNKLVSDESRAFRSLVSLCNQDLLVTAEMEWNGIPIDVAACFEKAEEIKEQVRNIDLELRDFFQCDWVNFESPKQLSVLLFGGSLVRERREQVGVYKTGQKIGLPRYKIVREDHEFRRLVVPLKGSELASGGFSTSEDHLRSVKSVDRRTRGILDLLLQRSKLEKLRGTYYEGLPKLMSEMGWTGGILHGQINHCIARTGRTSSSKPNLQNQPPEIDRLIRSRFEGGKVIQADAKGLEWVGIVYLAQDQVGLAEIGNGVDQHLANQERFGLPEKRVAKFFVFRLIYGGTAYTYTKDPDFTHVSTSEKFWQGVMDEFYLKYGGIKTIHIEWVRQVAEGNELVTPTGRKFKFYLNDRGEWPRTQILNYPVQSLGADLMALARVSLFRRMRAAGLRSVLINTIHDSIVLDICPEEWYTIHTMLNEVFADIPKNFERLFGVQFNLPMKCEIKYLNDEENK
jgi:DNA polymerase I-like protein with 3'-5' exonuclease and polymerase domains